MTKFTFTERLNKARERGNLTTGDLAVWFQRPYHTVRGWLEPRSDRKREQGYEPWGPHREEAYRRLENLEKFVAHNRAQWVLSPRERVKWIKKVARERNGKIPKAHLTS